MKTVLETIDRERPDAEALRRAGEIIRRGGLVAFPTETVYGLGGDALNPESSRKIYAAKGRPSDNPLIVHICRWEDIYQIAEPVTEAACRLAKAFWPGPLTMILNKKELVPRETTGGLDTVAVRFPSDPVAQAFIREAGGFVAAPSANTSGRPSPTLARYVQEDMDGRIEMILDGGEVGIGLESTIVDLTGEEPMILRPGFVTQGMLESVLEHVETDRTILDADCRLRPKAPGMRYRHYAPRGQLTIVEGSQEAVIAGICDRSRQAKAKGQRVGIIATDETAAFYRADSGADRIKSVGSRADEAAVGRSLYRILREFDDEETDVMFSESFSDSGFGQAIMNRLLKAAGHHVEQV
ncbi:MAG: L-threonylcarbamoyladenylate synthase [Eubacteriales bacterium]|nr:L-threonylcarbamoyladenylate synthase [Eubacteriales bacterium]